MKLIKSKKKQKIQIFFYLFLCLFTSLSKESFSLESNDYTGNLTLLPEPPPKPSILGLSFGENSSNISRVLSKMGLHLIHDQKAYKKNKSNNKSNQNRYVQTLLFEGLPKDIRLHSGLTGKSKVFFLKNALSRIDLNFPPSYKNFLLIRSHLFHSLGSRFSIEKKREFMESQLKTHLAHLKEFNTEAESAIKKSMIKGRTSYYYLIKDKFNKLNVILSFSPVKQKDGSLKPNLLLHYSLKNAMSELRGLNKKSKKRILPQNG